MTSNNNNNSNNIIATLNEAVLRTLNNIRATLQPEYVKNVCQQIDRDLLHLASLKKNDIKHRELHMPKYLRIITMENYLQAVKEYLLNGEEKILFEDREKQMHDYLNRLPTSERNERSLIDAWKMFFDLPHATPRFIAKDHCPYCKKPLMKIRKQAQLQCKFCARMIPDLMAISNHAYKNTSTIPITTDISLSSTTSSTSKKEPSLLCNAASTAQAENKRIKTIQSRLNQFRADAPPIPSEIILGVRHLLKKQNHVQNEVLALPSSVSAALTKLKHEKYIPFSLKIANIINKKDICELTDVQINEVLNRLRWVHFVFNVLQNKGLIQKVNMCENHFVHEICKSKGWDTIAEIFQMQRSKRNLRDQNNLYKQIIAELRVMDTPYKW